MGLHLTSRLSRRLEVDIMFLPALVPNTVLGRDINPARNTEILARHLQEAPLGLVASQVESTAQSPMEASWDICHPCPSKNCPRICLEQKVTLKREVRGDDLLDREWQVVKMVQNVWFGPGWVVVPVI